MLDSWEDDELIRLNRPLPESIPQPGFEKKLSVEVVESSRYAGNQNESWSPVELGGDRSDGADSDCSLQISCSDSMPYFGD